MGTVADITERKQAEEQLAEAHAEAERRAAEMESFFSQMSEGLLLHDLDGRAILANAAASEILGGNIPGPAKDRAARFQVRSIDGTPVRPEEMASARALRGETIKEVRYTLAVPVGPDRVVAFSAAPVRSAEGRIFGAATVFRDITEQAEFEQQRLDLFEREHHIAEILQQAIVPLEVPAEILGHAFAVKYRPALREAEVGATSTTFSSLTTAGLRCLSGTLSERASRQL